MKALSPSTAAMFFSASEDKVLCMAQVPKDVISSKGLKANDWCKEVQVRNGKYFSIIEFAVFQQAFQRKCNQSTLSIPNRESTPQALKLHLNHIALFIASLVNNSILRLGSD